MKLVAIDQSINGSGISICEVDDNYEIILESLQCFYYTETKFKAEHFINSTIKGFKTEKTSSYDTNYHKYHEVANNLVNLLPDPKDCYVILESNANHGNNIVDISEFTGAVKFNLIDKGYEFVQFEPLSIKTILNNKQSGKAGIDAKFMTMYQELYNYVFRDANVESLKVFKPDESPKADLIDSLLMILYYLKLLKESKND